MTTRKHSLHLLLQVTGTIASVRKGRQYEEEIDDELIRDVHVHSSRGSKGKGGYSGVWCKDAHNLDYFKCAGRERDEPSFIAEASFVKAPLNSRVGPSNVTPNTKGKGRQESLDRVPLEIQEALILEDLLFVLMVRFGNVSSPLPVLTRYMYSGDRRHLHHVSF